MLSFRVMVALMRMMAKMAGLLLACLASSCATATREYFADRGRDAADIFSVGIGAGVGAQARVSILHAGLLVHSDMVALRSGSLVAGGFGVVSRLFRTLGRPFSSVAGS